MSRTRADDDFDAIAANLKRQQQERDGNQFGCSCEWRVDDASGTLIPFNNGYCRQHGWYASSRSPDTS